MAHHRSGVQSAPGCVTKRPGGQVIGFNGVDNTENSPPFVNAQGAYAHLSALGVDL